MKKLIALGDIHGRTTWKKKVKDLDGTIVFVGDYFDTREKISAEKQMVNFLEIIAFKKANTERVKLLFGNHDLHYLPNMLERYSGYQGLFATDIGELVSQNLEHLQMCYVHQNYLFTHAGVTKTWAMDKNIDLNNIESSINDLFKYRPNAFAFRSGEKHDAYGNEICQTPVWVRPESLEQDGLDGYIQVVGHTVQASIVKKEKAIYIDTLGTNGAHLAIDEFGQPTSEF